VSPTVAKRRRAERAGRLAEGLGALLLRAKGYRILARNWRASVGEIDIVACRGRTLAFVEVKRRATMRDAAEAIGHRQTQRIRRAAEAFLAANPKCANMHARFDVMLIAPWRWPSHIASAWGEDWEEL